MSDIERRKGYNMMLLRKINISPEIIIKLCNHIHEVSLISKDFEEQERIPGWTSETTNSWLKIKDSELKIEDSEVKIEDSEVKIEEEDSEVNKYNFNKINAFIDISKQLNIRAMWLHEYLVSGKLPEIAKILKGDMIRYITTFIEKKKE